MLVDVTEIEGGSRAFEFTLSSDDPLFDEQRFRLTSDVSVTGEAVGHIAQIDVSGSIRGEAEVDCTRCLAPVPWPIDIDFKVGFIPPEHFTSKTEHEVAAEDLDVDILEDNQIDLAKVVREQILLNLPEQKFCRPDCKGLCLQCGADLNLLDCKCSEDETDPRWAALKNLK